MTGTLTSDGAYSFMIQTPGKAVGVLNALTSAANRVAAADYPYVWGGGHGQAGIASVGLKGPGYNGKRRGFDCSGSVVAVLVAGGLWPTGAAVPSDAGVIQYLLRAKLIARGAGAGPQEVTLYDDPGVHIFMNIDGRFFGTSDGGRGGDTRGGPGWLDDGASDVSNPAFKRYHFVAWRAQGHDQRRLRTRLPVRPRRQLARRLSGRRQGPRRLQDHHRRHDDRPVRHAGR